jgi:hypothetical protein
VINIPASEEPDELVTLNQLAFQSGVSIFLHRSKFHRDFIMNIYSDYYPHQKLEIMRKSFMKTTLTNVLPIDKTAKIFLGLRLWTKLDGQQPVIDRSLVIETPPIPPYDDPLY